MTGEEAPPPGYYVGGLNPSLTGDGHSRGFDGDIAEVIIYQGYLSDSDRLAVANYLEQRVASSTTPPAYLVTSGNSTAPIFPGRRMPFWH